MDILLCVFWPTCILFLLAIFLGIENKLGARGLRSICEAIMTDAMYDAPSSNKKTFHLTLKYAKEKLAKS